MYLLHTDKTETLQFSSNLPQTYFCVPVAFHTFYVSYTKMVKSRRLVSSQISYQHKWSTCGVDEMCSHIVSWDNNQFTAALRGSKLKFHWKDQTCTHVVSITEDPTNLS